MVSFYNSRNETIITGTFKSAILRDGSMVTGQVVGATVGKFDASDGRPET
ncbi:hypothetical protein ABNQ38_14600 (plasmid) [Azospirillum sp. A29]